MKKSLVLAMAMALGVTASAYAANPFSDVPAGHWAYDSISKLAAAGVIEGYGDGTFRGDRLMTRFEMAQIIAKAVAKGANVNQLAAEFADELDALGVRVAALEKKSDNVKITGEFRIHFAHNSDAARNIRGKHDSVLRSRLWFTGKINDNWKYVGRIENQQILTDQTSNNGTAFNIAKVEGRLGGVKVVAGRDDDVIGSGNIYDAKYDAVRLTYGNKWYVTGAYGKLTDVNDNSNIGNVTDKFWQAEIGTDMDTAINGKIGYLGAHVMDGVPANAIGGSNVGIFYIGADAKLGPDFGLNAMYLRSNKDSATFLGQNLESKKHGFVVGLTYKGAEPSEPGSWGLAANYYNQGRFTYLQHTIDGYTDFATGFKGWSIGGDVTVAKNMVFGLTYYDTKAVNSASEEAIDAATGTNKGTKAKVLWTQLNVTF
jgi:hypothetical protein